MVASVKLAADEEWRSYYGSSSFTVAGNAIESADNATNTEFGVDLVTYSTANWDSSPDSGLNACGLLNDLKADLSPGSADILIGFAKRTSTNYAGCAEINGDEAEVNWSSSSYNRWVTTQHEVSHLFSLPDRYPDPNNNHTDDVMENQVLGSEFLVRSRGGRARRPPEVRAIRRQVRLRRVATVAILAGLAAIAVVLVVAAKPDGAVATVGGVVITRTAYDEYAQVFTSPEGTVRVSEEDILLSLVNQVLVQAAADRRGLEISDNEVPRAVAGMSEADPIGQSLPKGGEEAAFRERVRMFLLFRLVKSEVVGQIDIPDAQIEGAHAADPSLHVLGYQDAIPVLRERLASRESGDRWLAWLKGQRRCAEIRILDASFDIPSSTPSPECGGADG